MERVSFVDAGFKASTDTWIAKELAAYPDTAFYTGHCTGLYAYEQLAAQTGNLHYLAAGESIQLPSAPDSKNGTKK